jgi:hypothetical protein
MVESSPGLGSSPSLHEGEAPGLRGRDEALTELLYASELAGQQVDPNVARSVFEALGWGVAETRSEQEEFESALRLSSAQLQQERLEEEQIEARQEA